MALSLAPPCATDVRTFLAVIARDLSGRSRGATRSPPGWHSASWTCPKPP